MRPAFAGELRSAIIESSPINIACDICRDGASVFEPVGPLTGASLDFVDRLAGGAPGLLERLLEVVAEDLAEALGGPGFVRELAAEVAGAGANGGPGDDADRGAETRRACRADRSADFDAGEGAKPCRPGADSAVENEVNMSSPSL